MTLAELKEHRSQILKLAEQYGATNVRVFGSIARGDAKSQSDVDILVNLEQGRSALDLGDFLIDLQELLGCRVDVVTERALNKFLRDQVLKEAISL